MCKKMKSELPFLCEEGPMRLEDVVRDKTNACFSVCGYLLLSKLEAGKQGGRPFTAAGVCRLCANGVVCVSKLVRRREIVAVTADVTADLDVCACI